MYVIKKDGTKEEFNVDKIIAAVNKSASRIMYRFTENEIAFICEYAKEKAKERSKDGITIPEMHNIVEGALDKVNPAVAKSYRDYRNYNHKIAVSFITYTWMGYISIKRIIPHFREMH